MGSGGSEVVVRCTARGDGANGGGDGSGWRWRCSGEMEAVWMVRGARVGSGESVPKL